MTTADAAAQPADLTNCSVNELQERAMLAFQNSAKESKHTKFDHIGEALAEGAICGKPVGGAAALCMLYLLEQLHWAPSIDLFAKSMPHFPDEFTVNDVREVLGRLGFASSEQRLRVSEIEPGHMPAIALDADAIPLIVTMSSAGTVKLLDPTSGEFRPLPSRPIRLIRFEQKAPGADESTSSSWTGQLARRFRPTIAFLLCLTFVINLMIIATSLAVMAIYDAVLPSRAMDTLLAIGAGVGMAFGAELWLRRIRARMIGRLAGRIEYLLGSGIFAKLMALPLSLLTNVPLGSQISRLKQFETIRDLVAGPLVTVGLELPFVLMFVTVLFVLGGPLGFIPLALIVVYAVVAWILFPVVRRLSAAASELRAEQYRLVLDTLANLRTIHRLGCEQLWLERIGEVTVEAARSKRRALEANRILSSLSAATIPVTGGATVLIGAHLVMNGSLTVGALIACMIVIWRVITPIQQCMLLLSRYADLSRLIGQLDRLFQLTEEKTNEDLQARQIEGAIRFDRATFRYSGTIEPALLNLMINIRAGELVAVSGSSGAGKTTLLRLILNLYQPQSGSVTIDGINVRQLSVSALRSAIGYVPQQPAFFHGTIAQNLRLAAPSATEEDLRRAAAELDMLTAIMALPSGFDTRLDEFEQSHMAQGFRQALAIMQALLRKPQILLLDEPVKALDPQVERAFVKAIKKRRGNVTVIMVTHRPSHVQMADRSIVIERGQIIHNGAPQPAPEKVPA